MGEKVYLCSEDVTENEAESENRSLRSIANLLSTNNPFIN